MKTMQDYSCYCTKEQTRRAYKLGAPIMVFGYGDLGDAEEEILKMNRQSVLSRREDNNSIIVGQIPTTQQMIGWLREEKHLTIVIDQRTENNIPFYRFLLRFPTEEEKDLISDEYYGTWNKMELTAIDVALDYLEKGGIK